MISPIVYGDEPPCWCEFTILSENKEFRADIEFLKSDSLKKPWERNWEVKVYEINPDTSLIWVSKFLNDGYGAGILSNDGQLYTYVNYWLQMDYPNQIIIYSKDEIIRLSGKDLGLDPSSYRHTVSHQIWMKDYYLTPDYQTDTTSLIVETLDSKKIDLNLKHKIVKSSVLRYPELIKQNNLLKKTGYAILIFLCIGIILIIIRNCRLP